MFGVLMLLGVVELFFPRQLVDFWMQWLVEDGEEVTVRPWAYSLVRLEGIVIILWVVTKRQRRMLERRAEQTEGSEVGNRALSGR
ncbi:hypothetical protein [Halomarina rubra]|uniref:Uncharacterized protein n=1 Tax=Halomarina rubra TaxID=2071873 RepID=A0ABD6AUI2_9EURY|nr:hypothetical protein [Halomarina rubra]